MALWNRVLTEGEVLQLAADPLSSITPLVGDSDGDQMSDIYEINHGLDPNVSNVGMDTDGDGVDDVD